MQTRPLPETSDARSPAGVALTISSGRTPAPSRPQ